MAWTTPVTFNTGDPLTAVVLNQQVRDNLGYLYEPPRDVINSSAVYAIAVATLTNTPTTAIDDINMGVSLTTTGRDIQLAIRGVMSRTVAVAEGFLCFDFFIDGLTYASTGTATPANRGIGGISYSQTTTAGRHMFNVNFLLRGLSAGSHIFLPRWANGNIVGTGNISILGTDMATQVFVTEI